MTRFDFQPCPRRRVVIATRGKGYVMRLAEKGDEWRSITPVISLSRDELTAYERSTRSPGAVITEWKLGPLTLSWEWRTLTFLLGRELWAVGDRSQWEAGIRRLIFAVSRDGSQNPRP